MQYAWDKDESKDDHDISYVVGYDAQSLTTPLAKTATTATSLSFPAVSIWQGDVLPILASGERGEAFSKERKIYFCFFTHSSFMEDRLIYT